MLGYFTILENCVEKYYNVGLLFIKSSIVNQRDPSPNGATDRRLMQAIQCAFVSGVVRKMFNNVRFIFSQPVCGLITNQLVWKIRFFFSSKFNNWEFYRNFSNRLELQARCCFIINACWNWVVFYCVERFVLWLKIILQIFIFKNSLTRLRLILQTTHKICVLLQDIYIVVVLNLICVSNLEYTNIKNIN